MAGRIRTIKPEILEDEKTAALPHMEWRLFVSLWLIADDYGNLRGDPTYVLGQCLWAAGETPRSVAAGLDNLAGVGLIARYSVRGQGYCHISGWSRHQRVAHPGKARMPGPDEDDSMRSQQVAVLTEPSRNPHETLSPDLRSPIIDLDHESLRARDPAVPAPDRAPTPGTNDPKLDKIVQPDLEVVHPPTTKGLDEIASPAVQPSSRPAPRRSTDPNPAANVPAVSTTATSREDIEGTQRTPGDQLRRSGGEPPRAAHPTSASYDPVADPRALGRMAEAFYRRVSDARIAMAAELGLPAPLPFPSLGCGAEPAAFRDLRDRLREEGADAPAVCERVLEALIAGARAERAKGAEAIRWLDVVAFRERVWSRARSWIPKAKPQPVAANPSRARGQVDEPLSAEDRAAIEQLRQSVIGARSDGDFDAIAAAAAAERARNTPTSELVRRFGDARAGPRSAAPDDDHDTDDHHLDEETA